MLVFQLTLKCLNISICIFYFNVILNVNNTLYIYVQNVSKILIQYMFSYMILLFYIYYILKDKVNVLNVNCTIVF